MSFEIRDATTADIEGIEALKVSELTYAADPIAQTLTYIEHYPAIVAESEGRIIGFAYTREFSKDIIEICDLLVQREARAKGIGKELVRQAELRAKQIGYTATILSNSMLYSGHDKQSAVPFYESLGFTVIANTDHSSVLFCSSQINMT